ncbi:MAG: DUF1003 domain-containing protein [Gemmatimonadaceae bacterium]
MPDVSNAAVNAVVCPACGGANSRDAVFCANPDCRKALGEFAYVREELAAAERWYDAAAERAASFVGHPYYVVVHVLWFALWVLLNTGLVAMAYHFDDYPFGLLGILLAVEAILVTGILLISQNRQNAHADKRAELDYEVNVRTYREIHEIKRLLVELEQRVAKVPSSG